MVMASRKYKGVFMSKHKQYEWQYRWFLSKRHSIDGTLSGQEHEIYELIDCFVREKGRRMDPVPEDRCQSNEDTPLRQPYPKIVGHVLNACFGPTLPCADINCTRGRRFEY